MLMNQCVAAEGELPTCQDTGTAIAIGKKGEDVYTGVDDAEYISKGVYETYAERNLRYSQVVPFTMIEEKNSGNNMPAQIDIYATKGNADTYPCIAAHLDEVHEAREKGYEVLVVRDEFIIGFNS